MITCSRHSDIEKETRKQEKMAPLVISPPLSFHYSGGFREGARGAQTPPPPAHYFLTKLWPNGLKKIFLDPAPPPPPAYLRVWITPLLISRSGSATALLHFEAYLKISKCKKYFVSNHFFYSSYIAP